MSEVTTPPLDLDAYRARVDYRGPLEPTRAALEALHLAHVTHVPFENLDVHLGRPIRLDVPSLAAKLVRGRRGGYCFEHNTLFAAVLEAAGFRVTRLAARVRLGAARLLPRTHMLLEVEADGVAWLADVGFGDDGLLLPLPLVADGTAERLGRAFRTAESGGLWVLQAQEGGRWLDLYAFTREPHYPVDFEMASHYTSTHPDSIFVRTVTAQKQSPTGQWVLRNRDLAVQANGKVETRRVTDDGEYGRLLTERFGLALAPEEVTAILRRIG